jgi:translocation and assembly module TamB
MATLAEPLGPPVPPPPPPRVIVHRSLWVTAARWFAVMVGALITLIAGFLLWLNSDYGHRFIADRINGLEMASGLRVHVDGIEGSIWDKLTVSGLTLADSRGVFFEARTADLDYSPVNYIRESRISIDGLAIPEARLSRIPQLVTTDPNAPLIPDMLLDIDALRIDRLLIEPAVSGHRNLLSIAGDIHLENSQARTNLQVAAIAAPGIAGGDRLTLHLQAAPQDNVLNIDAHLLAPAGGFFTGLAGLDKAVEAQIGGRGTWANWQGRAQATLAGQGFADLNVQAQNGTFTIAGPTRPDLFVTGPAQRLTEPLTQANLIVHWENRRAEINVHLNSRALAVASEGTIDLRNNVYERLKVGIRLIQPGAIAPNLAGRDVRLALVLDGNVHTPTVAYELRAASLSFSERTLENFFATGSARVDADRIVVPVHATSTRLTGLPDAVGGLLTNVRMDGDLLVQGSNILSDNLRLRSDRADAVLALAFDIGRGRYNVGIQGRVNDYLVQSVGIFDISSNFDLVAQQSGSFGLQGRVALRSKRIFNATAADLLGGNAVASATVALTGDGAIRFGDVRVAAPSLHITEGGGVYYPDGRIALRLAGTSQRYGAVAVEIGGTIAAPLVQLRVANPGFGIGLANIRATIRAVGNGYAIQAQGDSAYGPFSADILVAARAGPLTIQVNRLLLAGMTFAGRLQQTAAGPFAGSLSVTGRGIDGNVALAAAGRRQRIDVNATAQDASIPSGLAGQNAITIQRALIDVGLTLAGPGDRFPVFQADGDVQVAGLTSGSLQLARARSIFTYAGNNGNARFVATGQSGIPFDVAGNADLSPERIRAALRGTANNIPFQVAEPAVIDHVGSDWILRPATLVFRQGQGSMRIAGRFGRDLILQTRLDSFDISLANAFAPGLGIGGAATGSLDILMPAGGAFPRAEARLNIIGFTRTGLAMRSVPVDMALAGNLRPEGGALAAVIRQAGAVVGRMQARLQPLPPGSGPWMARLLGAPLSGGIRYNGPASVLASLAGLAGHQISGPIGIGADFSGHVATPQFAGVIRAHNLTYLNETYGTQISNMAIDGRFDGSRLVLNELTGRAGDGTIRATGEVGLAAAAGFPIRLDVHMQNARLARGEDIGATATGDLQIRNLPDDPAVIRGRLELGELRYQIVRSGQASVVQLTGVRRRGQPLVQQASAQQASGGSMPGAWRLDLHVVADNRVFVSGMGLESEWAARLNIGGTSAAPELSGNINLVRGTLSLAGRRFTLSQQSNIAFPRRGGVINPELDIRATSEIDDVEVEIDIAGSSTNPRITFASTPGLPQDEIVSRILFGNSVAEISAIQAIQLAASLNSLRGGSGGLDPIGALRQATGIDRLRILGADEATGRGTAVAAGFYLSNNIYIEIITDARGFTATQLEISLSRALRLLSQFGSGSGNNVNLRYSRDY